MREKRNSISRLNPYLPRFSLPDGKEEIRKLIPDLNENTTPVRLSNSIDSFLLIAAKILKM